MDGLVGRALTLDERLAQARLLGKTPGPCRARPDARALDACRHWLESTAPPRWNWNEFLCDLRIDETVLGVLGDADRFQGCWPEWANTLRRLFAGLDSTQSRAGRRPTLATCLAEPVVRFASEELFHSLPDRQLHLLSRSAVDRLVHSLALRLASSAMRVVEWERQLQTEHELLREGIEAATARMLRRYPALARLWAQQLINWKGFIAEFLLRTEMFLKRRQTKRSGEVLIRTVVPDLSDLHNGNRTVLQLRLANGTAWFLKPRSGEHEAGWFALLRWLNEAGFSPQFAVPKIICADGHCWMEAISPRACRGHHELIGYFCRAGALLYLAHLLRVVDLHAGNIIAYGADPVLVDCETILHPRTRIPKFAQSQQQRGVLRTGLLPTRTADGKGAEDISGLGRRVAGPHLVRIRGRPVSVREFADEVIRGFNAMHAFLGADKYQAFAAMAAQHLPEQSRRIYRPTRYYQSILNRSLFPVAMIDGLNRSLLLQAGCRNNLVSREQARREVAALEIGDIPRLTGKAAAIRPLLSASAVRRSVKLIQAALNADESYSK